MISELSMAAKKRKLVVNDETKKVVDKILDKRIHNGKIEYFVSYKGFLPHNNSWVSKESLDCLTLIKVIMIMFIYYKNSR